VRNEGIVDLTSFTVAKGMRMVSPLEACQDVIDTFVAVVPFGNTLVELIVGQMAENGAY